MNNNNNSSFLTGFFRVCVWCVAIFITYQVVKFPLRGTNPTDPYDRCLATPTSEIVSDAEFSNFLRIWNMYINAGLDQKTKTQVSMSAEKPSEQISWPVRFWLFKNCWDADRFFYVEQRLRQTLQDSYTLEHTTGVIALLERLIEETSEDAPELADSYLEMIRTNRQTAASVVTSEKERRFVQGREPMFEALLSRSTVSAD